MKKFVGNGVNKQRPEKCSFCSTCEWQEECEKIWIKEDNLNQVGGLTKVHLKKLLELKFDTITKLSKQNPDNILIGFRKELSHKLKIRLTLFPHQFHQVNLKQGLHLVLLSIHPRL